MTLSRVHLGGQTLFEAGQLYVAISRVRSLEGLTIEHYDRSMVKTLREVDDFYRDSAILAS